MPELPQLTPEQVAEIVAGATDIQHIGSGGQKVVFRATINGEVCALKFASVPPEVDADNRTGAEVAIRAAREVETLRDCSSPYMVKPGPVNLAFVTAGGQRLLYFSEQFIEGLDLQRILRRDGPLQTDEVRKLGLQITDAIKELWALGKIHRDIKPGNIMRRDGTVDYYLLDAGLAFDVVGESVSAGYLVGTWRYFSPEQFDYGSRRSGLDFRSDIFALGITLYEAVTGQHPFWQAGMPDQALYSRVLRHSPAPPSQIVSSVSPALEAVILRMLGKSPHLRYRKCDQLIAALNAV